MEKSSLMMIVIIVLLVALLGTVVGVTFYAFSMMQNMESATQETAGFDRTPRQLTPDEIGRVPIGDSILTNLATDSGGSGRVARIQVVVGYDNTQQGESDAIYTRINEQMDFIRMEALASIRNRTYQELSARDGMDSLAAEILETLQNEFQTNLIVDVRFSEWILS